MVVVVSNDEALDSQVNFLTEHGLPETVALTPSSSFAAIAQAMGGHGVMVRSVSDLRAALEGWFPHREGPLVLDCRINPVVRAHFV